MISIASLVAQYLHYYPAESGRLDRLVRLISNTATPSDLIARTNFIGHVTASGFVFNANRTSVLLVHHRRLDMYVQPGGHLDTHDASPLDGARREVREETGLGALLYLAAFAEAAVPLDIDSHYIPPNPHKDEPEHWHHDFRYALVCPGNVSLALAVDEVAGARWVPWNVLGRYPTLADVAAKLGALVHTEPSREQPVPFAP